MSVTAVPPSRHSIDCTPSFDDEQDPVLQNYINKVKKRISDYKVYGKALPITPPQAVDPFSKPVSSKSRFMDAQDSGTFSIEPLPPAAPTKDKHDTVKIGNAYIPVDPFGHDNHQTTPVIHRRRSMMSNGNATGTEANRKNATRSETPTLSIRKPTTTLYSEFTGFKGESRDIMSLGAVLIDDDVASAKHFQPPVDATIGNGYLQSPQSIAANSPTISNRSIDGNKHGWFHNLFNWRPAVSDGHMT